MVGLGARGRDAVDGRRRGGGDAARPERLVAGLARGRGDETADGRAAGPHEHRDARVGAGAADRPARERRRRAEPARAPARRTGGGARGARHESGGRGDPPVHAVAEHEDLRRRPLPLPVRVDARARAARADVRAARPRRGARRRERDAGRQPPALAPAAAARAVGELALLAGPRDGPRLGAHAAVPGVPARGDPARVRRLRGLRLDDRSPAALRGVPRADVPVVGRAPAAALRDDRGAGSWTRRRPSPTRRR